MTVPMKSLTIVPPRRSLVGRVVPPGSKSITNRALLLAGLATGTSRVTGALKSLDTELMAKALVAMGVGITEPDDTSFVVTGQGRLFGGPATIELQKQPGKDADAIVGFTLDEAARARMGITMGGLSGSVGVRIASAFTGNDQQPAHVDLDLARIPHEP